MVRVHTNNILARARHTTISKGKTQNIWPGQDAKHLARARRKTFCFFFAYAVLETRSLALASLAHGACRRSYQCSKPQLIGLRSVVPAIETDRSPINFRTHEYAHGIQNKQTAPITVFVLWATKSALATNFLSYWYIS